MTWRGRVGEVVVAADDVGDAHGGVVHHGGEVVGGRAVGALDDEVVELAGRKGHVAVDGVAHDDVAAVLGHLDAQDVRLAGGDPALRLGGVEVAAAALVALEGVLARLRGLAVGGQLLGRAEARVRLALVPEALGGVAVHLGALGLLVGAKSPPTSGPSSQSRPSQRMARRMIWVFSSVERSGSVSSMRRMKVPWLARANAQL